MNKVMSQTCTVGVPNPDFDPDHEGHSGWRADQILNGIGHSDCSGSGGLGIWLGSYTPDISLIHLGTNDLLQGQSIESTVSELEGIIALLRADNPAVKVLLAKIIPTSDARAAARVPLLNEQIALLAARMDTATSRVVLVDMTIGFNTATDLYDGVHPNPSGEQKMAQQWYQALVQVLAK
jgi:lysophospholipase L1-like esterase